MKPLRSIVFVINDDKAGAAALGRELIEQARHARVKVKSTTQFPFPPRMLRGADACCVIGGDGSLLGIAAEAARAKVPIIGVNRGTLGFLTTFAAEEARSHFGRILEGDFQVDPRAMLECSAPGIQKDLALNDVLIKSASNSRLVRLEVLADGEFVTEYVCDGLIMSTATGSTAYNLSAGGPIVHPAAEVIAMTPICPHTLTNRSIIFRESTTLQVRNRTPGAALYVSLDGKRNQILKGDAPIKIVVPKLRLPLAQKRDYRHFAVVRTKLQWNGGLTP